MTRRVGCTWNNDDARERPRVIVDNETAPLPWWLWCWAKVFA